MEQQKKCPFCGELVLSIAVKCKHCGEFFERDLGIKQARESLAPKVQEPETTLWTGTPSHLNELGGYTIGILLAPLFGLGIIFIALIMIGRKETVYTITTKRVITRKGILTESTHEISMKDICSLNLNQSFIERVLDLGHIKIGCSASEDRDIQFSGISDAPGVRDLISKYRK